MKSVQESHGYLIWAHGHNTISHHNESIDIFSLLNRALLEDTMDENKMLNDVAILELSDNDSEDKLKTGIKIPKNKNPTSNIEEFWEPVPRCKGDATAHHQYLCCK
jgi:hypothetical protein